MNEPFVLDLPTYLARLGYRSAPPPTLETLRELQQRHCAEFVFETLSTLLHVPISVEASDVQDKLLKQGRGGYCFELNGQFLRLLQALGYDARGLTGRVVMNQTQGPLPARTHMLVLVTLDGARYITDVGFGGMVPTGPLLLDSEAEQATPHELYRLSLVDGSYTLSAKVGDEWRAMYLFDMQPPAEIDYVVGNWYVCTHPDSPFLGQLLVARTGDRQRTTLHNGSFATHHVGERSQRVQLRDVDEVLAVLHEVFGIRVPQHPDLHAAIERVMLEGRG
ncbi:MAG: arylamine N-acetyltransferase family protein [Pseudomonas sp.]|uniref:arylamine N-acetyltransferase family protein n=1 Tax=Pseudomonas sp. TaxID=306 RepID=UPI003D0B9DBA